MNIARYLKMSALAAFAIARLFATITPAMGQTRDAVHSIADRNVKTEYAVHISGAQMTGLVPQE